MKFLNVILLYLLLTSCATRYKNINLRNQQYPNTEITESLVYAYRYDVLRLSGNKKYSKKEDKYEFKIVGIKIENLTNESLAVRRDLEFRIGEKIINPVESSQVTSKIEQPVYTHLLYGLIWADFRPNSFDDLLLPVGIPIAAGNMIVAGKANKAFANEFGKDNLVDKIIEPRKTYFGFIAYRDGEIGKLSITIK